MKDMNNIMLIMLFPKEIWKLIISHVIIDKVNGTQSC